MSTSQKLDLILEVQAEILRMQTRHNAAIVSAMDYISATRSPVGSIRVQKAAQDMAQMRELLENDYNNPDAPAIKLSERLWAYLDGANAYLDNPNPFEQ